jgi:hypothetical protein
MKLVYEKTAYERQEELVKKILDAINDAKSKGKNVKKILVTKEEWNLLVYPLNEYFVAKGSDSFYGLPIEVEEKPNEG